MEFSYENFVNNYTVNIFTDAATGGKNEGYCAYGCLSLWGWNALNNPMYIEEGITNNSGEARGIACGVHEAIRLRNTGFAGVINIFSDSLITLQNLKYGVKRWKEYYSYSNDINADMGIVLRDNKEMPNFEDYVDIVKSIGLYEPNISFYHVKGHMINGRSVNIKEAKKKFCNINEINPEQVEDNFIHYICTGNNDIDLRLGNLILYYKPYFYNRYPHLNTPTKPITELPYNGFNEIKQNYLNQICTGGTYIYAR